MRRILQDRTLIGAVLAIGVVYGIHQFFKSRFPNLAGAVKFELVSVGSFGELGNARNLFAVPLAILSLGSLLVPLLLLSLILSKMKRASSLVGLLVACAVFAVGFMFVTSADYSQIAGYELSLVGSIIGLFLGLTLLAILPSRWNWPLALSGAALSYVGNALMSRWRSLFEFGSGGSVPEMMVRVLAAQTWIPVVLFASTVFVIWSIVSRTPLRAGWITSMPLFVLGALSWSLLPVASTLEQVRDDRLVEQRIDTRFIAFNEPPSRLVDEVLASTSPEDVLASNAFCTVDQNDLCMDLDWWQQYERRVSEDLFPVHCVGSMKFALDSSLPAMTNRRFLIQSPNYFDPCGEFPEWLNKAVINSESFARNPSQTSLDYLCNENVGWFIADGLTANRTNWEPFARKVLEDGRFSLLKINKSMCG